VPVNCHRETADIDRLSASEKPGQSGFPGGRPDGSLWGSVNSIEARRDAILRDEQQGLNPWPGVITGASVTAFVILMLAIGNQRARPRGRRRRTRVNRHRATESHPGHSSPPKRIPIAVAVLVTMAA
jgi:hypothetical protein